MKTSQAERISSRADFRLVPMQGTITIMLGCDCLDCWLGRNVAASVGNDFADVEKWLPMSRLLITYVAGPYPDAAQCSAMRQWIEAGGHWLGLHGTSGGRAERVEGMRSRRTVKTEHHALLGGCFLTHPPIRRFRVDVRDVDHPVTRGIGSSFEVEDEPYFVELQDPGSTRILLTADYGPAACRPVSARCIRRIPHCSRTAGRACSAIRAMSATAG